jgi:hypothetical protein
MQVNGLEPPASRDSLGSSFFLTNDSRSMGRFLLPWNTVSSPFPLQHHHYLSCHLSRSQLVQIDCSRSAKGVKLLTDWVQKYFSGAAPQTSGPADVNSTLMGTSHVAITNKMPIMLQHKGHSRMIVGCEMTTAGEVNLLFFDPAKTLKKYLPKAPHGKSNGNSNTSANNGSAPSKKENSRKRRVSEVEDVIEISDEETKAPRLSAQEQSRVRKQEDTKCHDLLKVCRETPKGLS